MYVDDAEVRARVGRVDGVWSHLTADTPSELLAFAARLRLRHDWLRWTAGTPHFDVTRSKRKRAVRWGAQIVPHTLTCTPLDHDTIRTELVG